MSNKSFGDRRRALLDTLARAEAATNEPRVPFEANLALLGRLQRPEAPAELSHPDFLASIYDRAASASQVVETATGGQDLGALLVESLPAKQAEDLPEAWDLEAIAAPKTDLALTALPRKQAPGWLWARIRSDVRRQIAERRKPRLLFRVAAVAALVLATTALAVVLDLIPGTHKAPEIVIQVEEVDQPPGDPFHPAHILRELSR